MTQTAAPARAMSRQPLPEQLVREQVGRNIARARRAAGLSQAQLAEALDIDRTQLSAWERARKLPSADKLFALSAATGHDHDFGWFYSEHGDDGA